MCIRDSYGGVHPDYAKTASKTPVRTISPPPVVVLPMIQQIGAPVSYTHLLDEGLEPRAQLAHGAERVFLLNGAAGHAHLALQDEGAQDLSLIHILGWNQCVKWVAPFSRAQSFMAAATTSAVSGCRRRPLRMVRWTAA